MKIGTKLTLLLTLPLIALMIGFGYLSQRASRERLRAEMLREGRGIALTARVALEDYLRDRQIDDIRELAEKMSGYERVAGMRIFRPDGSLSMQSQSLEAYPFVQVEDLKRALEKAAPRETRQMLGNEPVVSFLFPLRGPAGEILGAAQIYQLESYVGEEFRATRNILAALTLVMILGAAAIVLTVTRLGVGRPIEDLVRSFREVGTGGTVARVAVRRKDEFGRLAGEFNTMCRRLEAARYSLEEEQAQRRRVEDHLRDVEPLATLGRFSAGLAHEIGTPLNVIGGRAESLRRKLSGNEFADRNLSIIVTQIDRIARIVPRMLDFAKAREPQLAPTLVSRLLRRVLEFLAERFEEAGVTVEANLPLEDPWVLADSDQMYEVFLNLITNAVDAMPQGGRLRLEAKVGHAFPPERRGEAGSFMKVSVEDTGTGIRREHLDRIFDPFFTTKGVGKGSGLGLSVSRGIVRRHGGWIEVSSQEGRGTRFTVYLPVQMAASLPGRAVEGGGT
ncbi:MAG: ATP-binding protein [Acidobacteria bacterium]|nr:ATP-binding protein [Acidobacteriota bacterium]